MARSLLCALAVASSLPATLAWRNTSPYFFFSTAALNLPANDADIAQAESVVNDITAALESCPTETYFVVRQERVSATDYAHGRAAPRLAQYLSGKNEHIKSQMVVPDVIESRSKMATVTQFLQDKCGAVVIDADKLDSTKDAHRSKQRVIEITYSALSSEPASPSRAAQLGQSDANLAALIAHYEPRNDFTVIYTTTPAGDEVLEQHSNYEMEYPFDGAMQMELKRHIPSHKRAAPKSKQGGLFETYQYFTPGLFMGLIAIVPLFTIVGVGIKAITSLETSYFAFSKEMGPAAQRKQ